MPAGIGGIFNFLIFPKKYSNLGKYFFVSRRSVKIQEIFLGETPRLLL
jgi:hypothetical protein